MLILEGFGSLGDSNTISWEIQVNSGLGVCNTIRV